MRPPAGAPTMTTRPIVYTGSFVEGAASGVMGDGRTADGDAYAS
jgi:hypothetical protein